MPPNLELSPPGADIIGLRYLSIRCLSYFLSYLALLILVITCYTPNIIAALFDVDDRRQFANTAQTS